MRYATVTMIISMAAAGAVQASTMVGTDFSGGNDNTATYNPGSGAPTSDSFKGTNGNGWSSAWSQRVEGALGTGVNRTGVINTSPLTASGGNYLNVDFTNGTSNVQGGVHEVRSYATLANGGIDTTQTHTVSFKFRLDSALSDRSLTNTSEFIRFFDNNTSAGTGSAATSWIIYAGGYASQTSNITFRLQSGDGNGTGNTIWTDTGIVLANNVVYSISVTVHPVAGSFSLANNYPTWDVTINDGTNTFTQTGLRFRNNATTSGRTLQFGGYETTANTVLSYSIDDLTIAVPEAASLSLVGLGALALLSKRHHANH